MKTFARATPKSQEKILIENAKHLYENPYIILPACVDKTAEKYFKKIRKRLDKIYKNRDNLNKLEKFSHKKGLDGAVAGTLQLVHSEKVPFLGVVSFATGAVTYAHRGKADKEKLIAVQHYTDPILRILGFKDIAYAKNLSMYSWDTGFVCTGTTSKPPKEFINFILRKLGVSCTSDICSYLHLSNANEMNEKYHGERFLRIYWRSADTYIAVCESCAKKTKNTFFAISKYLIEPKLSEDFDVRVFGGYIEKNISSEQKTEFLEEYFSGSISDLELIQKNIDKRMDTLQKSKQKMYIYNNISYGEDIEKFLNVLHPSDHERKALVFILERIDEPLIANQISANKILEKYWQEYGLDFIKSVIPDGHIADSFFQLEETPSEIVKLVLDYQQRQQILSQLPTFSGLSELGIFADTITKTYKTFGDKKTYSELKKHPDSPQGRSLAYAFLLALNKATETKWRYSQEEIEYGSFLKPYVEHLINAEPSQYTQYLRELLKACGSTEQI